MLTPIVLAIVVAHPVFALAYATDLGAPQQAAAAVQAPPDQPWPPAGVYRTSEKVTPPRLTKEAKPRYTLEAKNAKIQGTVVMEAVVKPDGKVGDVRVTRSLDTKYGLDDEAVATVKNWRFAPGRKNGTAVPVLVEIEMTFTLRGER